VKHTIYGETIIGAEAIRHGLQMKLKPSPLAGFELETRKLPEKTRWESNTTLPMGFH